MTYPQAVDNFRLFCCKNKSYPQDNILILKIKTELSTGILDKKRQKQRFFKSYPQDKLLKIKKKSDLSTGKNAKLWITFFFQKLSTGYPQVIHRIIF